MIFRTQMISRSGVGLVAIALMFELTGIPITSAALNRQQPQFAEVKERLRVAAAVSLELAPLADISDKIPRQSHVRRYSEARPWVSLDGGGSCDYFAAAWPTTTHAPALRAMLGDPDPKLRALAVEALATLRLPEDLPRIARLLADKSPAPPYVQRNDRSGFTERDFAGSAAYPDPSSQMYSWYPATVSTYARRAIWTVTEESLDAKTFSRWWAVNKDYCNHLWYWNLRIRRAVRSIEREVSEDSYRPEMGAEERKRLEDSAEARGRMQLEQLQKRIADEVMLLEPETAAKILLLLTDCENGRAHSYFEKIPRLSLSASRLLELLDRQRLWPDVDWEVDDAHYTRLVHQIMVASPSSFGPEHVTPLQGIFARRRDRMWWNAQGAMFVGISRLLPAARGNFNPATREGYLRAAIEGDGDMSSKNMAATELVRVDFPHQWEYLKSFLFSQAPRAAYPDLAQTTIRGLGECPITAAKREALLELLKEPRIQPLLTQADDRYRLYLGWTIRDQLAQETSGALTEFSSSSGNPLDALPGIVERLEARAKASPPVQTCR